MDNAPIHKPEGDIVGMIEKVVQKHQSSSIFHELSPIEQFQDLLKRKVKRRQFGDAEGLNTRIAEAIQGVPVNIPPKYRQTLRKGFKLLYND